MTRQAPGARPQAPGARPQAPGGQASGLRRLLVYSHGPPPDTVFMPSVEHPKPAIYRHLQDRQFTDTPKR